MRRRKVHVIAAVLSAALIAQGGAVALAAAQKAETPLAASDTATVVALDEGVGASADEDETIGTNAAAALVEEPGAEDAEDPAAFGEASDAEETGAPAVEEEAAVTESIAEPAEVAEATEEAKEKSDAALVEAPEEASETAATEPVTELVEVPGEEEIISEGIYGSAYHSFGNPWAISVNQTYQDYVVKNGTTNANYYRFSLSSPGYISVSLPHAYPSEYASSVYWTVKLYRDEDKANDLATWSVLGEKESYQSCNVGLPAGTYYVVVSGNSSKSPNYSYNLRVNYTQSAYWETELNNTFDQADVIMTGATYTGSIMKAADIDYYKIVLPRDGAINLYFQHAYISSSSASYWKVSFFSDEAKDSAMFTRTYKANDDSWQKTAGIGLKAGTYYLKVQDYYSWDSTDYHLNVSYSQSDVWEKEYNSSFYVATPIKTGTTYYGSMMEGSDEDFYVFTLGSPAYVSVRFRHDYIDSNSSYWRLYLYNTNNKSTALNNWYVYGKNTTTTTNSVYLGAGTYYIKVDNGSYYSLADYNLLVNLSYGGWKKTNGKWWYQYINGSYPRNKWAQIDGKWYHFDSSGYMQTGWLKDGGKWYYLNSSGVMVTGWQKVDGKWYYFNGSGVMQTGWVNVSGKWYYMNSSGILQTGWVKVGSKWYYTDSSGVMQTGWKKVSGKWYYFNSSGVMQTGWVQISGKWYYMNGSGVMQTGWLKSGGKWYYLDSSGVMLANTSRKIGNKTYRFNASGVCTNP